jgi:hypothetical protein
MIPWQTCQNDFKRDGSLRDIYVLQPTIDDWRVLFNKLSISYKFSFWIDGKVEPFPASVDDVLSNSMQASTLLNFKVGTILVACHFFTPDEIEFNIDPKEITSQSDLDVLLKFLRFVGNTVNKPVLLTPENLIASPIISYDPLADQCRYHPFPDNLHGL